MSLIKTELINISKFSYMFEDADDNLDDLLLWEGSEVEVTSEQTDCYWNKIGRAHV